MNFDELINKYDIPMNEGLKSAIDSTEAIQAREWSDRTYEYKELEFLKANLYKMYANEYESKNNTLQNKVYILLDNCVWDDDDYTKIVAASFDKNIIKEEMKKYVEKLKKDIDFDNIEISDEDIEGVYVVEEDENSFSIYENGEYNSFHSSIYILEQELLTELSNEKEEEYGL